MVDGFPEVEISNVPRRMAEEEIDLPPNGTSLDLLQAVYRNADLPLVTRMRAAMAALSFEHPKLEVVAQINEQSFAEVLERRLKRIAELEATQIDASKPEIEVKPPMPRLSDRRYRRM